MAVKMSTIEGTVGKVLYDNIVDINKCTEKGALVECLKKVLGDRTDKDAVEFLANIKAMSFDRGMKYLYDYLLAGDGCRALKNTGSKKKKCW